MTSEPNTNSKAIAPDARIKVLQELETPIWRLDTCVKTLHMVSGLTLELSNYKMDDDDQEVFSHLIGEVVKASRELSASWTSEWNSSCLEQIDQRASA